MYLQHGNNKIKWFILLIEHPNCVGKVIINELFNLLIILNERNGGRESPLLIVYIMQSSYQSKVKAQFTDETEEDYEDHCIIKEGQYCIKSH